MRLYVLLQCKIVVMAKSLNQQAALAYAKQYLDRILELESYVGERLSHKLDSLVETKVRQMVKKEQKPSGNSAEPRSSEEMATN